MRDWNKDDSNCKSVNTHMIYINKTTLVLTKHWQNTVQTNLGNKDSLATNALFTCLQAGCTSSVLTLRTWSNYPATTVVQSSLWAMTRHI